MEVQSPEAFVTIHLDRQGIGRFLKDREPFVFIDRADVFSDGSVETTLVLKEDSHYFFGHFPDDPIMPGIYLQEMIAQTVALGVLVCMKNGQARIYPRRANNVEFLAVVRPGDSLTARAKINSYRRGIVLAEGFVANQKGVVVCRGSFQLVLPDEMVRPSIANKSEKL